jgi:L-alanine-DL-glutamate epimerase-like enolase superfamily enzyme
VTISRVEAFPLEYQEPNDNDATRYIILCRIETTDGVVGWGEAITQFAESTRSTAVLIDGLADILVGRDPLRINEIWDELTRRTWWYGYEGGIASFAISAIDVALWDVKGKILGQPVSTLIGGQVRDRLPAIASTHAFHASLDYEIERHGRYVTEGGYQGVKVGMGKKGEARLGYDYDRDVAFVAGVRAAIGADAKLMMDRGQSLDWDVAAAIKRTQAFADHGLFWMEEPLEPTDEAGFKRLRQHVSCLIGTAEREFTPRGYRRVIESGIVDVVGFDPGRAGGITGGLKVIALVEAADLWFNAHAWSSAVTSAASLALSASTRRCLLFEFKPIANPMQDELVTEPLRQHDGWAYAPQQPGLGIEVVEEVVRRYQLS